METLAEEMAEARELKRSTKGLQMQIISFFVFAIILALFTNWLIGILFGWSSTGGKNLKLLVWCILGVAVAIGSIKSWLDWNVKRYQIGKDALIVQAKTGKFGSTKTIYRYESMISLRMSQGFLGKRFGYGDVYITIPKLDQEVVMNDIDHPLEQLAEVQKRIGERTVSTEALIN